MKIPQRFPDVSNLYCKLNSNLPNEKGHLSLPISLEDCRNSVISQVHPSMQGSVLRSLLSRQRFILNVNLIECCSKQWFFGHNDGPDFDVPGCKSPVPALWRYAHFEEFGCEQKSWLRLWLWGRKAKRRFGGGFRGRLRLRRAA